MLNHVMTASISAVAAVAIAGFFTQETKLLAIAMAIGYGVGLLLSFLVVFDARQDD